jgi:hypothetical protein
VRARQIRSMTDGKQMVFVGNECKVHLPPGIAKVVVESYGSVWVDPWEDKRWAKIDDEREQQDYVRNICERHLPYVLTQQVWEYYGLHLCGGRIVTEFR